MKVVILCGGEGTRLREETEYKPKPMVTIGGLPILWYIMKTYSHYGYNEFVLCLGYKGDSIKQFFMTHEMMHNDVTIKTSDRARDVIHKTKDFEDWTITFADTGLKSNTGSRIKRIEKYIGTDDFFLTYGDGLIDSNIEDELKFHRKMKTIGTLTAVHPHSKLGLIKPGTDGLVETFVEKPVLYDYVNGGFYVFKKDVFDYLDIDENCALETKPMERLVKEKQLAMYKHEGFWHAMDTYKDYLELNGMWDEGKRPWKVWK
ncbi:MAG: sugar phosphate nucleotidyltransferase [Candidatus Micrarchaeota archaeon]|nr:sugar phosphate nucleotidyltransferase [Candidatus Micrarchaeota archaeon]